LKIIAKKFTLTLFSSLDLARNSAAERASITFQFLVRSSYDIKKPKYKKRKKQVFYIVITDY